MPENGGVMSFDFELEHGERCCGFCQNWVMKDRSVGECMHWHQAMIDAGFHAEWKARPPLTDEGDICDNFTPDHGQIRDYRNADYTRRGAV